MPLATQSAVQAKPQAVVLLEVLKKSPNMVAERDFEPIQTDAERQDFLARLKTWADDTVKVHLDVMYVLVEMSDTALNTVDSISVHGGDEKDVQWLLDDIKADSTAVYAPEDKKKTATKKPAKKAAPKAPVKARKASAAAEVVKGAVPDGNVPQPKGAAQAARLKARLAAKQAEQEAANAKPADVDQTAAPEGDPNSTGDAKPLGWIIPLARKGNGRFVRIPV